MEDKGSNSLNDYKFFCFNGKVKLIEVDFDRFKEHKRNLYDCDWNYKPVFIQYPTHPEIKIPKPKNLEKMIYLAQILSENIPFVRVDFYNILGQIYFGVMTFYHDCGFAIIKPKEFELGSYINLLKD